MYNYICTFQATDTAPSIHICSCTITLINGYERVYIYIYFLMIDWKAEFFYTCMYKNNNLYCFKVMGWSNSNRTFTLHYRGVSYKKLHHLRVERGLPLAASGGWWKTAQSGAGSKNRHGGKARRRRLLDPVRVLEPRGPAHKGCGSCLPSTQQRRRRRSVDFLRGWQERGPGTS